MYSWCAQHKSSFWCATAVDSQGVYTTWEYCDLSTCPTSPPSSSSTITSSTTLTSSSTIIVSTSSVLTTENSQTFQQFYYFRYGNSSRFLSFLDGRLLITNRSDQIKSFQKWSFTDDKKLMNFMEPTKALSTVENTCCNLRQEPVIQIIINLSSNTTYAGFSSGLIWSSR